MADEELFKPFKQITFRGTLEEREACKKKLKNSVEVLFIYSDSDIDVHELMQIKRSVSFMLSVIDKNWQIVPRISLKDLIPL